ncbi:MAG TPA: hypothetical protein ENI20_00570 [Bacteroides sp.]|nr:hypothetical protein [Bacteroides sp.]
MKVSDKNKGFVIAIAWPETYCKQPGSWYDPLTLRMGFNRNNYYQAGHAAVVLINPETKKCHYFDFGRYHAPFKHGRVRSVETDHELRMDSIPIFSEDQKSLLNLREILFELQHNKACHGEGELFASYCRVDFQAAIQKAEQMQLESPISYGPFLIKGSNCSRFVNSVIRAGRPGLKYNFRLKFLVPLTPTPRNNVNSLNHRISLPANLNTSRFIPSQLLDEKSLNSALQPPSKNGTIPDKAQWLSGEGAGSWFVFEKLNSHLKVIRYSPEGKVECSGLFISPNGNNTIPDESFRITYPSNCKEISFRNGGLKVRFERVNGEKRQDASAIRQKHLVLPLPGLP